MSLGCRVQEFNNQACGFSVWEVRICQGTLAPNGDVSAPVEGHLDSW